MMNQNENERDIGTGSIDAAIETTPEEEAQLAERRLAALLEFYRSTGALCRKAIAETQGRRPYIRMEVRGHRAGRSIEVFPGVRGWYLDHGRRARMVDGKLVDQPITAVKVCARTMLEAIEAGVKRLPAALQAQAGEQ